MIFDEEYLRSELNPEQYDAATHIDGPLLILAGAGSGKTRVITYRIAYMVGQQGINPRSILAITFTNKAAGEMKERIASLVGRDADFIRCGTFHSVFARILRRHVDPNFTIIDSDDQNKLVRDILKEMDLSNSKVKPSAVMSSISYAKNHMITPEDYLLEIGKDYYSQIVAKVYAKYNERLKDNHAMDFDDILLNTVKLFETDHEVLEYYQERFRYIMVDEYQDTNLPQYRAVMLLAARYKNICVVGDDDQSIYAFRGANVEMILNFEKDFPDAKVVKLEENYRSTGNILEAANGIISNNVGRTDKKLRTSAGKGDKVILMNADSGIDEARFVADTIKMMVSRGKWKYSDVAVLYRVNAMSRNVDKALHNSGIPFRVYGGIRFFDRKEIKDIIAYLRLINDERDNLAFERIINVPRRGIGDTTINRMRIIAEEEGLPLFEVAARAFLYPDLSRSQERLAAFVELIQEMQAKLLADDMSFAEYIEYIENESGIIEEIISEREKKGELIDRVENLKELLSEAADFEKAHLATSEGDDNEAGLLSEDAEDLLDIGTADTTAGILRLYLDNAALYAEGDNFDDNDDYVRLMTVHSAKGLEFTAVFLIGLEETIFPGYRSMESEAELEEERRLMYVAVTRAKKNLFLVMAQQRMLYGQTQCNRPSRFISEIDRDLLYPMGVRRTSKEKEDTLRKEASDKVSLGIAEQFRQSSAAKAMESKTDDGSLKPDEIKKGMKVVHPRFGEGVILKVEPVGGDALLSIDFDGMKKNLLAKSAHLKKA
ncbi:MAG: UvrD-helicase domain-containing protein [Saccharofermentans sp.]|nr:UvrD-helicase domain-containing protein [Saccharofermentans sp.]